jgi:predicted adenine nucleotide alpha hydrolase (AANH) superfamily ATPase
MLDDTLKELRNRGDKVKVLMQACCAPCSSAVLEYLSHIDTITTLLNTIIIPNNV